MDIDECIATRRSIRKYSKVDVEQEKIGEILKAGKSAPSAGNLQNWKFILVTDKEKRKKVAEACLQQHWMIDAPVHIVVCAEPEKAVKFYGERGELYSVQNCAAAIQNMLLTAHSLGLSACWIGAFEEGMLRSALSIIPAAKPQAVITVGYGNEEVPVPLKYTLETVTFFEKWGTRKQNPNLFLGRFGAINKQRLNNLKSEWKEQKEEIDKTKRGFLRKLKEVFVK